MLTEEADFEAVERLINVKWDIMQQVRVKIVYQALLEKKQHIYESIHFQWVKLISANFH